MRPGQLSLGSPQVPLSAPEPRVQGGDLMSGDKSGRGLSVCAWSWLFKLLNYARGRHSSSLRYLNYKYG